MRDECDATVTQVCMWCCKRRRGGKELPLVYRSTNEGVGRW